ncbi:MAG: RidA family protein [Dorea sp.]|nr:RidA family protein [Dorea sp.]
MSIVSTKNAPAAIGPYSQGVCINGFVFVSGQLPINPESGEMTGDIKEKTAQSLRNIAAVLEEAGSSLDKIVKTTIFVSDLSLFADVNQAYGEFFKENAPARSCVQAAALPKGADIEIEAIAYV